MPRLNLMGFHPRPAEWSDSAGRFRFDSILPNNPIQRKNFRLLEERFFWRVIHLELVRLGKTLTILLWSHSCKKL
jgi:hypothetical protein